MLSTRNIRQAAHRRLGDRSGEAGYGLVELMVVSSLLIIVLGAILALGETTQRIAPKESERALVIREAQVGLHRMTRELRHASQAPAVTGSTMQAAVLTTNGGTRTVSYECNAAHPTDTAYTRCIRYDLTADPTKSNGQVVVDRVLNGTTVFSLTPPDYVGATIEVAARGNLKDGYDHRVILEDGIYMRNLSG